ncbi:trans-aconitate 2-methyltransferase [Catenulispora sp. GP43]|uniref:class I SAM-dependent methyltransferase n=1 Tax=Catenulispora sp. GP43 TaxID=3156263 RepID=UPI0035145471
MAGHWDEVYIKKGREDVSWFQTDPRMSLELIRECGLSLAAAIVDVGGGASVLGSRLLADGFSDVTVLDIAESALAVARDELGFTGSTIAADVREWRPEHRYQLWHDRAVFHFLTAEEDRAAYRRTVDAAVEPDGWVAVGTFATDGPEQCSGLPTARYDADTLAAEFSGWDVVDARNEEHTAPRGMRCSRSLGSCCGATDVSRETADRVSRETSAYLAMTAWTRSR